MPAETEVLIVGAGPTGLTLACELAARGVAFRIVDAAPAPPTSSRAKGTQPRTLEVFAAMGVIDQVLASGRSDLSQRLYQPDGSYIDREMYAAREARPDIPYANPIMIPQSSIEAILHARLAELGGKVEYGVALTALTHDTAGITASFEDEADCRAAWLVGCDGGKSTTRHLLGVDFIGETPEGMRMLLGDVRLTGLDRDHWHMWRSDHGHLALAPLPATDLFQFQASPPADDPAAEPTLALFQDIIDRVSGRSDIRITDAPWMSAWRANIRMVDRYRVGRAFLAGDAAHVHSPAGGQGMNTGIQDAYNLAWKLAAVCAGADEALLDSYQEERLPIAAWVLRVSTDLTNKAIAVRGLPAQRDDETLQLGLHYRGCNLSRDLRGTAGSLTAGDRLPDAPGAFEDQSLHQLLVGPHATVLACGDGWAPILAQARAHRGVRTYQIAATAAQALGVSATGGLLIVRPDGYIGLITERRDPAPVAAYVAAIAP